MLQLRDGDPSRVGPYQVLGRLGSGGMGQVYLAAGAHGDLAAVKLVHRAHATDPQFRARFRREVTAGMRLRGPGLAAVLAADADAPVPWLATEYIPGPALDLAVRETGPLPLPTLHTLAAGLATALSVVHTAGLVHRDVKPPNVLLAADGPRLIDMGIARAADATQLSTTGALVGTPAFMSPEQVEGHTAGPASDVFSLAAVLVYAATGHGPFGDAVPLVLLRRIADEPADLSGLPEPLREPIAACLAKDPGERPGAAQLAERLGRQPVGPGAPAASWLPAPVVAMIPRPADLEATRIVGGPAASPRTGGASRRGVLAGAAAVVGLAVAGGIGLSLGTRGAPPGPAPGPDVVPSTAASTAPPAPRSQAAGATVRWTATGPQVPGVLMAVQDAVYVGGGGTVLSLDAATGTERWRFEAPPGGVGFGPDNVELAVADGAVHVATRGRWFALDAGTGRQRWSIESSLTTGYQANVPPLVQAGGGTVYLAHGDTVRAVDAASGTERWRHTVTGNFAASPTVDGPRILVSDGTGVDTLDSATGRVIWRHPPDGDNATAIAVAGGAVFLAVNGEGVVCLDAATGAVRWQAAAGTDAIEPRQPAVVDGAVVVLGRDELLHAVEAATGAPRWDRPDRTNGGGSVATAPVVSGALVYGGSENGRVYAIEARSGDVRWAHVPPALAGPVQVLAAAGEAVFAASFDGQVSALDQS